MTLRDLLMRRMYEEINVDKFRALNYSNWTLPCWEMVKILMPWCWWLHDIFQQVHTFLKWTNDRTRPVDASNGCGNECRQVYNFEVVKLDIRLLINGEIIFVMLFCVFFLNLGFCDGAWGLSQDVSKRPQKKTRTLEIYHTIESVI